MSDSDDGASDGLASFPSVKWWKGKEKTTKRNVKLVPTVFALVWSIIMVAIGAEASTCIIPILYSSNNYSYDNILV